MVPPCARQTVAVAAARRQCKPRARNTEATLGEEPGLHPYAIAGGRPRRWRDCSTMGISFFCAPSLNPHPSAIVRPIKMNRKANAAVCVHAGIPARRRDRLFPPSSLHMFPLDAPNSGAKSPGTDRPRHRGDAAHSSSILPSKSLSATRSACPSSERTCSTAASTRGCRSARKEQAARGGSDHLLAPIEPVARANSQPVLQLLQQPGDAGGVLPDALGKLVLRARPRPAQRAQHLELQHPFAARGQPTVRLRDQPPLHPHDVAGNLLGERGSRAGGHRRSFYSAIVAGSDGSMTRKDG